MRAKLSSFEGLRIVQTLDDIEKIKYQLDNNLNHWLICDDCGNTTLRVKVVIVADAALDLTNDLFGMKEYQVNIVNVEGCDICESKNLRKIGDAIKENTDDKKNRSPKTTRLVPRHTGD